MAKKKITIDDLAGMVKRGFDEFHVYIDKRFDAVDNRFDAVDDRFDAVDDRFDAIDKRFANMEQRMVNLESGMSYLKARVHEIDRTLDEHTELLEEHIKELQWIHKKIDEWTDPRSANHHVTYKEFSDLESRVRMLEKKTTR